MSVDLLRRAAAKIRDAASTADPGPWASDGLDPNGNYYVHDVPDATPAGYFGVNVIAENAHEDNANHIALWSPDVAELVADVLDETAEAIDFHGVADIDVAFGSELALARRILGESS